MRLIIDIVRFGGSLGGMRDDLHRTAKCHRVWQDLFGVGLNDADRAHAPRLADAAAKAIERELRDELTDGVKKLLRALADQPALLDAADLIAGYAPKTALEIALCAELRGAKSLNDLTGALTRALDHQIESYLREFDCRMVEGKVFNRAEVEQALRDALNAQHVQQICAAFVAREAVPITAPPLSVDEDLIPPPERGAK